MRVWHRPTGRFKLPKSSVHVRLIAPALFDHARDDQAGVDACVANAMLTFLVRDALSEYAYVGELAGLSYR